RVDWADPRSSLLTERGFDPDRDRPGKPSSQPETRRRHDDAVHGAGQSGQEFGGGRSSRHEAAHRDGEVQRRAGESRRAARGRGAPPELEGRARQVLRGEAHRHRRALHRGEGADRRLLAVAGEVEGGGDRVAQARPVRPDRGRDPTGVRGGRLRARAHARAQGARGALARARDGEAVVAEPRRALDTKRRTAMRFMIIVKATKDSEAGVMPKEELLAAMAKYHEELQKAGVLLDASGLQASSKGWRIKYSGEERTLTDGPFTEARELIAGYT